MIVAHRVGREAVERCIRAAGDGAGGVVVISGEPGVGKSAVVDAALADAAAGTAGGAAGACPVRVVRVRCTPAEADTAWAALSTLAADLRTHLGSMPDRPRDLLAGLVGWGPAVHGDTVAVGMACLALLIAAADTSPLVIVIDDARHLDTESRTVLEFAARRIAGTAIALVIVSTGDEPGFTTHGEHITLGDLDHPAAIALLRARGVADPVAEEVIAGCGTRPLVLVDVAARLTAEQRNGAAALPTPLPAPAGSAAMTAAQLYADRVDQLPVDERNTLAELALGGSGPTVPRPARGALPVASELGLVHHDGGDITLVHPLVGHAVLGTLSPSELRATHARLATALGEFDAGRARWHRALATEGPDAALAADLEQAAADASAAGQPLDAYRLMHQAARISPPADRRRRQLVAIDAATQARLIGAAATLLDQLGRSAPDAQLRAARLQAASGDLHGARRALLALVDDRTVEPSVRDAARLDAAALCLRMYDLWTVDRLTAPAEADNAGDAGNARDDPEHSRRLAVLRTAAYASIGLPSAIDAIVDHTRQALERALTPHELTELAESFAITLARAGRRPELFRLADVVQRRATESGVPGVAPALLIARAAYLGRSDLVGALDAASEAVTLIEELHHAEHLPQALTHQANALAGLGDPAALAIADRIEAYGGPLAEGAAMLVRCAYHRTIDDNAGLVAATEATHWRIGRQPELSVLWHLDLFEAALAVGRDDLVTDIRTTLVGLDTAFGASWVRAGLDRVEGLLAPDLASAVASWERSASTFAERGYTINAARSELVWATRLLAEGDPSGAAEIARRARVRFAVAGMGRWIARCDDLVGRTGAGRGGAGEATHPTAGAGDPSTAPADDGAANRVLTHRELQVARWLVEGATYRQIADQLFVSARTVESHCGAIYRKLGVRGRSGLAARALTDRTLQMLADTP